MANINMRSVLSKVGSHIDKIDKSKTSGKTEGTIDGLKKSKEIADELKNLIVQRLNDSVGEDFAAGKISDHAAAKFSDISVSVPVMVDGSALSQKYEVLLTFNDPHARQSLYPEKHTDGADNVISLLNNGYSVEDGKIVYASKGYKGVYKKSVPSRAGARFVTDSVADVIEKYNGNGITLTITADDFNL